mmetsp:Transcript_29005/g.60665  ORF Transcript_29005/g.60665 Transcript_29005/m.60665 type:complete len:165 (-) Transcript_29005:690-1184(-)
MPLASNVTFKISGYSTNYRLDRQKKYPHNIQEHTVNMEVHITASPSAKRSSCEWNGNHFGSLFGWRIRRASEQTHDSSPESVPLRLHLETALDKRLNSKASRKSSNKTSSLGTGFNQNKSAPASACSLLISLPDDPTITPRGTKGRMARMVSVPVICPPHSGMK